MMLTKSFLQVPVGYHSHILLDVLVHESFVKLVAEAVVDKVGLPEIMSN